ncbi:MAG TPA: class I SAM-dependent methyltransferase [Candidatus Paenibacillus intestinavium]|nr:class I SAM-dependent methyltransferase [Candidatus Paenibacillus intestinavium]
MKINFGNVSNDYAKYRDRLPEVLFEQLKEKGITFKNKEIIELGAGTGIVSRHLVEYGAKVIGIEPSIELIEEAAQIDRNLKVSNIKYILSTAEDFEYAQVVPLIIAVRAWHWFNRSEVLSNIEKYLENDGHLIVINSIFKPDSEIAKMTFEVLTNNQIVLKPAGSNADAVERKMGFPLHWFNEWESHSLQLVDAWQQDYMLEFTHEEWCGKIRSVSWLTNESDQSKTIITNELIDRLSPFDGVLKIPHQYSIAILRHSKL